MEDRKSLWKIVKIFFFKNFYEKSTIKVFRFFFEKLLSEKTHKLPTTQIYLSFYAAIKTKPTKNARKKAVY